MRELYQILGFTEEESRLQGDEFQKLCKKKYRELSKKWHPDRWSNKSEEEKKNAEAKFKEINEANEILSNPEKRQMYDLTGSTDGNGMPNGQGGFNPFERMDPFDGMFVEKADSIRVNVTITLAESYVGGEKTIKVPRKKKCSHCNGTGSSDGKSHKCGMCNGTGYYTMRRTAGFGSFFSQTGPCPYCGGNGNDIKSPCSFCNGSGEETEYEERTVIIPPGIFDGAALKLEGQGNVYQGNGRGVNGDLIITFRVTPDPQFTRDDDKLIYNMQLTLREAIVGCKKTMKNLDGSMLAINIAPLTLSGTMLRVAGKGFRDVRGYGGVGDLMIRVKYKTPTNLTSEQLKLLEKFCEIEEKK